MRRSLVMVVAGGVALLAGGVVASASSGITGPKTIHLKTTNVEQRFLEIGHSGPPKLGDEFILHQKLTDQQGHDAGYDGVVCVITSVQAHGTTQCTGTASLAGGEISVQVLNAGNSSQFDAAVTGGTGDYENARGEAEITSTGANTGTLTFLLIP